MRESLKEDRKSSFMSRMVTHKFIMSVIVFILVFFALGISAVFLPDQFTVKNIEVENTRPEIAAEVKSYADKIVSEQSRFFGKTSIFLVPREYLENEIPNKFFVVKTVQILRRLPSTVKIVVQEKVPVAILKSGGRNYSVDPNGVAFENLSEEQMRGNKYPVISDERSEATIETGKTVMDANTLTMMHDISRLLPERFTLTIDGITIPAIGTQELHVHTSEGWMLVLDSGRALDRQFTVLEKVLMEEIDNNKRNRLKYIDLRADGKAFYKFKDGS